MRNALASIALVGTLALSLTACGSSNDVAKEGDPVTAPSAAPITPTPAAATPKENKSVRGNLIAHVGDIGTQSDPISKKVTTKFTVKSIAPVVCTEPYAQPSKNGQLIALDFDVETMPELAESSYTNFHLSTYDFKFIDNNGTTFTGNLGGASWGCLPETQMFPSAPVGPAEKVAGKVILDVPAPTGILVFDQSFGGGFEYKF